MNENEQQAWHAVHVTDSKQPDDPVAVFQFPDQASRWAEKSYPGRHEIRPCVAPAPSHRPDTPNLNALEPFLFTIAPGWYWVGTGVKIGDQDRMLVVQQASDADVARLQGLKPASVDLGALANPENAYPPSGPCETCGGSGRVDLPFDNTGAECYRCGGSGIQPARKESDA